MSGQESEGVVGGGGVGVGVGCGGGDGSGLQRQHCVPPAQSIAPIQLCH